MEGRFTSAASDASRQRGDAAIISFPRAPASVLPCDSKLLACATQEGHVEYLFLIFSTGKYYIALFPTSFFFNFFFLISRPAFQMPSHRQGCCWGALPGRGCVAHSRGSAPADQQPGLRREITFFFCPRTPPRQARPEPPRLIVLNDAP